MNVHTRFQSIRSLIGTKFLSRKLKLSAHGLYLSFVLIFITPAHADDTKHLDDTVASGIVFKLVCILGAEGTWSTMETKNPESFQNAMILISKDFPNFSDTERGASLKKDGEQLVSFLTKAIVLTSKSPNKDHTKIEADNFLKALGMDPKVADPAKLAEIFSDHIESYAKQSNTPSWVYDRSKR